MRLLAHAAALLLVLPGAAAAQGRSPIPDHWLTLDSLSELLALAPEQQSQVSGSYNEVNALLQRAVQRREELRASFRNSRPVAQMTAEERQTMMAQLADVRAEYEGRQAELDQQLAALRSLLTAGQQARFDGLAKPRLVPAASPQGATAP